MVEAPNTYWYRNGRYATYCGGCGRPIRAHQPILHHPGDHMCVSCASIKGYILTKSTQIMKRNGQTFDPRGRES